MVAKGEIIAEHPRCFGRDKIICNPWHYLSVLEKKPGALRHGIPFQNWDLPEPIQQARKQLSKQEKGDRAFLARHPHYISPWDIHVQRLTPLGRIN